MVKGWQCKDFFLRGLRLRVATQRNERSERIWKRQAYTTEGQTRKERRDNIRQEKREYKIEGDVPFVVTGWQW